MFRVPVFRCSGVPGFTNSRKTASFSLTVLAVKWVSNLIVQSGASFEFKITTTHLIGQ
jgi:hypothetical protein